MVDYLRGCCGCFSGRCKLSVWDLSDQWLKVLGDRAYGWLECHRYTNSLSSIRSWLLLPFQIYVYVSSFWIIFSILSLPRCYSSHTSFKLSAIHYVNSASLCWYGMLTWTNAQAPRWLLLINFQWLLSLKISGTSLMWCLKVRSHDRKCY